MPGPPLRDSDLCFWHSPSTSEEVAEAQKLGGLRRRRERALAGAYDMGGCEALDDIQRLVTIAVLDTLSLENSVARSRTLAYLAQTAIRVQEAQRVAHMKDSAEDGLAALVEAIQNMDVPDPDADVDQ